MLNYVQCSYVKRKCLLGLLLLCFNYFVSMNQHLLHINKPLNMGAPVSYLKNMWFKSCFHCFLLWWNLSQFHPEHCHTNPIETDSSPADLDKVQQGSVATAKPACVRSRRREEASYFIFTSWCELLRRECRSKGSAAKQRRTAPSNQ